MTNEEKAVLAAAVAWHRSHQTGGLCSMSNELHAAVRAYRKSLEAYHVHSSAHGVPPVGQWTYIAGPSDTFAVGAKDAELAGRICRLLNESEAEK